MPFIPTKAEKLKINDINSQQLCRPSDMFSLGDGCKNDTTILEYHAIYFLKSYICPMYD